MNYKKLSLTEIRDLYNDAAKKFGKAFNEAPENMDFIEFNKYMNKTGDVLSEISRELRLREEPTFSELDNTGDVMSLKDFIDFCECGGFIDHDGFGYYVRDGKMSDIKIFPSDIKHNKYRKDFDTIVWYNK